MLNRLLCGLLASGGTLYQQVLVGEKLKSGKRGNTNIAKTYSNKIVLHCLCISNVQIKIYSV
jgi:hypothetical protein